ncbi:MAG: methyltransferase domain-containing protein [Candidatus Gracilibacteria bacterium]|nr:methyltransferase domain-containing protein [Candidatus Gracilibacteria bacterium]
MDRTNLIQNLREYGIENTVPNISDVNAQFLVDLMKISHTKTVLEIGTANGFSAINFGDYLSTVGGHITTIDFSPKSFDEAQINFKEAQLDHMITSILGNALDEIPKLPENQFDFVFIDGMMRRSKDFLELSWSKTKPGGIIIIDDVIKFGEKMVGLWEFLEENNITYNTLPIDEDDGVMMIIKEGRK